MPFLHDPFLMYTLIILRQQRRLGAGCDSDRKQEYWIFHLGGPLICDSGTLHLSIELIELPEYYISEKYFRNINPDHPCGIRRGRLLNIIFPVFKCMITNASMVLRTGAGQTSLFICRL